MAFQQSMAWLIPPALLLGVLGSPPRAFARQGSQDLPPDTTVLRILEERIALGKNPGIVVGLLDRDGSRILSAGSSGREGVPLDRHTVFEIGSITKVFTAALLVNMVGRGEVGLEDPVASLLPDDVTVPEPGGRPITLSQLATHSSGLPRMPTNFRPENPANPFADYTVEDLYRFLSGYGPPEATGQEWEYSNLGFGLLGHALARRAGSTYESLLAERILSPLGMTETAITLSPALEARFCQGHGVGGQPVPHWDIPALAGAGALRSTAGDMLAFAEASLSDLIPGLSAELERTQEIRRWNVVPGLSQALGWMVNQRFPDRPLVWHNGGTGGFHSFLGLDRERGLAVVILTNGVESIDDMGFHFLDPRQPLQPPEPLGGSPRGVSWMVQGSRATVRPSAVPFAERPIS